MCSSNTHCQSLRICPRWSSLDLNATWQVLQVNGWESAVFGTVVGWSPLGVDRLAITVAMVRCGSSSCSPGLGFLRWPLCNWWTGPEYDERILLGLSLEKGKRIVVIILSYTDPVATMLWTKIAMILSCVHEKAKVEEAGEVEVVIV